MCSLLRTTDHYREFFPCLCVKFHKSLFWVLILASGGPYWVLISQKNGSLLGPYLRAWGSLLVLETVDYASSQASALRTHLKTHSGEKPNKCNQCDYASSQAGHLKAQFQTHSGEKSNKCNQCNFASFYESSLRNHLKTNSGERLNK